MIIYYKKKYKKEKNDVYMMFCLYFICQKEHYIYLPRTQQKHTICSNALQRLRRPILTLYNRAVQFSCPLKMIQFYLILNYT